jgi:hypothetical protein
MTQSTQREALDPKPWLFISDQVLGEIRSERDRGYHGVSGTWWAFSPRPRFAQDRDLYTADGSEQ